MAETKVPDKQELASAVELFYGERTAEKKLYDLLGRIPSKKLVSKTGDGLVLFEQHYEAGRVMVTPCVVDLRESP